MPGGGASGAGSSDGSAGTGADTESGVENPAGEGDSTGSGADPGFGDMAGGADLPSMVDTLPTFDEDYGSEGNGDATSGGSPEGEGNHGGSRGSGNGESVASTGEEAGSQGGQPAAQSGTRASGGMESDMVTDGPLTAAEQVAILDRQLEESTRDFDGIIYDEEQRQREAARDRAAQTAQTSDGNMDSMKGEEPEFGGGGVASAGSGSVGGGIGGRSGAPPADGAKYPPPADIPSGNDDDVVSRQLREAAMREPDPAIREKLWAEYRKYKGIAEPGT